MKRNTILVAIVIFLSVISNQAFASVSYLGPAGTYTEEATLQFFGQNEKITPAVTVAESLALLKAGKCQYAVVPVENTIGGPVYNYLEAALADDSFVIVGQVDLPIRQTLLGVPGANLQQIKTILSHPQGIAQSKNWIKENIADAKLIEVSSTAEAARRVAEAGDVSMAAIAASRTASVYQLDILANDLQYTNTNVTRFWVITLKTKQLQNKDKVIALVRGPINSVAKLIAELDEKAFKIQTLHDLPTKTKLGEYQFVMEVTGYNPQFTLENVFAQPELQLQGKILSSFNSK